MIREMFDTTYMGADWAQFEAGGGFEDDPKKAACEVTVQGGRCTSCEKVATELWPTGAGHRICGTCWDASMDLLAKAVSEGYEGYVFVTAQRAEDAVAA